MNKRNDLEKFNETVGILVKAFLNDELEHSECSACAVGNIIRANGIVLNRDRHATNWLLLIDRDIRNVPHNYLDEKEAILQISSTGYSAYELHLIELAFESTVVNYSEDGADIEKWNFDGLMNVVECLAQIHNIDLSTKEKAKSLFVKV
jgi:hypothetical protein